MSLIPLVALLLAGGLWAPQPARADGVVENVVVRNRKFHVKGDFEVSPSVGFSMTNRLTEHTNLQLGLGYHLLETFSLELRGGWALPKLTSVARQVQKEVYSSDPNISTKSGSVAANIAPSDFENLWQLQWQGFVLPRWSPIYGKLNLATELPIHFQAYLTAGGGMVGLKRESLVYCQNGGTTHPGECRNFLTEDKQSVAVAGGGGLSVFLSNWWLLNLELFDIAYADDFRKAVDRRVAEQEQPGAEPRAGAVTEAGFANVLFFNLGTSFIF